MKTLSLDDPIFEHFKSYKESLVIDLGDINFIYISRDMFIIEISTSEAFFVQVNTSETLMRIFTMWVVMSYSELKQFSLE